MQESTPIAPTSTVPPAAPPTAQPGMDVVPRPVQMVSPPTAETTQVNTTPTAGAAQEVRQPSDTNAPAADTKPAKQVAAKQKSASPAGVIVLAVGVFIVLAAAALMAYSKG